MSIADEQTIFFMLRVQDATADYLRSRGVRFSYATTIEEVLAIAETAKTVTVVVDVGRRDDAPERLRRTLKQAGVRFTLLVCSRNPGQRVLARGKALGAKDLFRWPHGVTHYLLRDRIDPTAEDNRATRVFVRQRLPVDAGGVKGTLVEFSATGGLLETSSPVEGELQIGMVIGDLEVDDLRAKVVRVRQRAENLYALALQFVDVPDHVKVAIDDFVASFNVVSLADAPPRRRVFKVRAGVAGATRTDYFLVDSLLGNEARLVARGGFDPGWQPGMYLELLLWRPSVGMRWGAQLIERTEVKAPQGDGVDHVFTVRLASSERTQQEVRLMQRYMRGEPVQLPRVGVGTRDESEAQARTH
jgi:hypothetical protein